MKTSPLALLGLMATLSCSVPQGAENVLGNGGFEDPAAPLSQWDVFSADGGFHADVVADPARVAEGRNAVRLWKSTAADGCIHRDNHMLPWRGGHVLQVAFRIKDDPTLARNEFVRLVVAASDTADLSGFNRFEYVAVRQAGTEAFATFTERVAGIPATTKSITMNLRITDAAGAPVAKGDVLLDDVQVRDLGPFAPAFPAPLVRGYNDLNGDGAADTLAFAWNDRGAIFVADDGRLPWGPEAEGRDWDAYFDQAFDVKADPPRVWNPARAGWGNYTILVDRDGNGLFDDATDFYYKAMDMNGDGAPEAEYYHLFPGGIPGICDWSNKLHVNLSGEREMSYLDWQTFWYADEQRYLPGVKYFMNVHGSGFFLNSYSRRVQNAWENPIAWYDFDFDGRTNMVMRAADTHYEADKTDGRFYRGDLSEMELAFEVNGNTSPARMHSLDFQLTYYQYAGKGPSYQEYTDRFPLLAGLPQAAFLSGRLLGLRQETLRRYWPYMDGYKLATDCTAWAGVWLMFDEDDDDCRWEEMFNVHEASGGPEYSDRIGDRAEVDSNFDGGGKLYVSPLDGRIHLYKAEEGWWEIDYLGLYKGSVDRPGTPEGPEPPAGLQYPLVRYFDTDGNGFVDKMEFLTVRYKDEKKTGAVQKTVRLLDYTSPEKPHPDEATLFDPRVPDAQLTGWTVEKWDKQPLEAKDFQGTPAKAGFDKMYAFYGTVCDAMWGDAQKLYQAAKRHGLNRSENLDAKLKTSFTRDELAAMKELAVPEGYSRHLAGTTRREKYDNGYWLREKVFADIVKHSGLPEEALNGLYYSGRIDALCAYLDERLK